MATSRTKGAKIVDRSHGEDCIPFNPKNVKVKKVNGRWKVVDGSHWILDFKKAEWEAYAALAIIKNFDLDSTCFVGRPGPSMIYFLRGKKAPGYATKWVIPNIRIKLDWNTKKSEARLKRARALCEAFNVRLFDATDAQCRVAKFAIYDKSRSLKKTDKGVGHIYQTGESQHGHSSGRPNTPNHFHVRLPTGNSQMRQQAGTMFMEWCHYYTGTRDEYETADHDLAKCPSSALVRAASNACIMYRTGTLAKLCRPGIHNPTTEQGQDRKMSCYEWIAKVMKDANKGTWQIPNKRLLGTADPIAPKFEYRF